MLRKNNHTVGKEQKRTRKRRCKLARGGFTEMDPIDLDSCDEVPQSIPANKKKKKKPTAPSVSESVINLGQLLINSSVGSTSVQNQPPASLDIFDT